MRLLSLAAPFLALPTLATAGRWITDFFPPIPASHEPPTAYRGLLERAGHAVLNGTTVTAFVHLPHDDLLAPDHRPFHVAFSLSVDADRNLVVNDGEAVLPLRQPGSTINGHGRSAKAQVTGELVHLPHRPAVVVLPGMPPEAAQHDSVGACPQGQDESLALAQSVPLEIELMSATIMVVENGQHPRESGASTSLFVRIPGASNTPSGPVLTNTQVATFSISARDPFDLSCRFSWPTPFTPVRGSDFRNRQQSAWQRQAGGFVRFLRRVVGLSGQLNGDPDSAPRGPQGSWRERKPETHVDYEKPKAAWKALGDRLRDEAAAQEGGLKKAKCMKDPEDSFREVSADKLASLTDRIDAKQRAQAALEQYREAQREDSATPLEESSTSATKQPRLGLWAGTALELQERDESDQEEPQLEKRGVVTHPHHRVDPPFKPKKLEGEDLLAALRQGGRRVAPDDTLDVQGRPALPSKDRYLLSQDQSGRPSQARREADAALKHFHRVGRAGCGRRRLKMRVKHLAVAVRDHVHGLALSVANVVRRAFGVEPLSLHTHKARSHRHALERTLDRFPGQGTSCRDVEKAAWIHEQAERTLGCRKAARKALYRFPGYRHDHVDVEKARVHFESRLRGVKERAHVCLGKLLGLPFLFGIAFVFAKALKRWREDQAEGRIRLPNDAEEVRVIEQQREVEEEKLSEKV